MEQALHRGSAGAFHHEKTSRAMIMAVRMGSLAISNCRGPGLGTNVQTWTITCETEGILSYTHTHTMKTAEHIINMWKLTYS